MKIVNIIGGLGNQMLQYAFALALKQKHPNEKILIDISHFHGYNLHNGYEIKNIFGQELINAGLCDIIQVSIFMPNYKISRAIRRFIPLRKTEHLELWQKNYGKFLKEMLFIEGNAYYEGYWHNPHYYDDCEQDIRRAYTFPQINDPVNLEYAKKISETESICMHVRRGDYIGAKAFTGICDDNYYHQALSIAIQTHKHPELFIFSNDIPYCETLLSQYKDKMKIHFVNCNSGFNSFRDMQLMSLGKCVIIANSTFSWWGAWLNTRDDHIVISPKKWVNFTNETDMIPKEWIKIDK